MVYIKLFPSASALCVVLWNRGKSIDAIIGHNWRRCYVECVANGVRWEYRVSLISGYGGYIKCLKEF